ncbi:hypothetical protein BT96DRAFT_1006060 [Gymnopus androsaceus JB14]|uniref:Uncharacterized protein n=1 Tax=Gymnopus androsaceus JB14 TaxID=1447944 RepID=A0A6A4GLN8_9AGAR|nr:hypothetical protein BT96DRAFT_1006060 [Gymnopus androsaceus JB14]
MVNGYRIATPSSALCMIFLSSIWHEVYNCDYMGIIKMPSSSQRSKRPRTNDGDSDKDTDAANPSTPPRTNKKSRPNPPSSPPQSSPKSNKSPHSSPSKKSPKASNPFHIRKKQLNLEEDDTLMNFKLCIEVHLHLLSGCFKSNTLPTLPSAQEIEALENKFRNNTDPYSVLDHNMQAINPNDHEIKSKLRKLREDVLACAGGTYASKIASIPEHSIRVILGMVKASGLDQWKPDILSGAPDSLYNQLHQQVFNKTFETTVVNFGYRHLQVAFHQLENAHLLDKLYNNYMFSHWRDLLRKEAKEQGSVEKSLARNKVYKRRETRCKLRKEYQVKRAWPTRAQHLISEPACHSDDEDGPDGEFFIFLMSRRSAKATAFVRSVDDFMECSQKLLKRRNAYKRIPRKPHPANKISELEGLPSPKAALDWHDPTDFNLLPTHIRALYINSPIALPLESVMEESEAWKDLKMSDEEFMQNYGNAVRALYNFPTEEEIYAMKHGALKNPDKDDEEEELGDSADEDDDDDDSDDAEMEDGNDVDADSKDSDKEGEYRHADAEEEEFAGVYNEDTEMEDNGNEGQADGQEDGQENNMEDVEEDY